MSLHGAQCGPLKRSDIFKVEGAEGLLFIVHQFMFPSFPRKFPLGEGQMQPHWQVLTTI
jgi:hypothetical protein